MKNLVKTIILAVPAILLLTACENEKSNLQAIEGTYTGSLVRNDQLKNTVETGSLPGDTVEATAKVLGLSDNRLEIHCYGSDFDTTFTMDYYTHHDSAYVCFTGEQFEHMYGHMPGAGHMGGGMNHMMQGETEWMHHLNDEHMEGDRHFGGFDMQHHTFGYTFQMENGNTRFQGTKQ